MTVPIRFDNNILYTLTNELNGKIHGNERNIRI